MTNIDFTKGNGLVPAVIQDNTSSEVYMVGFINKEAFEKTKETGYVHFWSRKRQKLWMKGEESGNKLKVVEILLDCDSDSLLIKAHLEGTHVCHTGNKTCFFEKI